MTMPQETRSAPPKLAERAAIRSGEQAERRAVPKLVGIGAVEGGA
jgi:hypothetical protein